MSEKVANDLNPFHSATDWPSTGENVWTGHLTTDWTQGRTAFGGFAIAGALRALDELTGADRRPRTLSATLMDAIGVGDFEAHGQILRAGKGVSVAEMELRQGDTHAATVLATFGVPRNSKVVIEAPTMPEVAARETLRAMPYIEGVMPPCQQHVETYFTEGQPPFTQSKIDYASGWIRLRNAGAHPEAVAVALLDSFPFPFMQTMTAPAPVTTIMLTAHFLDLEETALDDHWWLQSRTLHAANGYATFETKLYRPDGNLGAWAEQLVGIYDK